MSSDIEHILYGGPNTVSLENAKSFGEFCYNRLKSYGELVLLVDGITCETVTASQLLSRSIRVAECLQHYGVKCGDNVAICCENRVEVTYVMFAIFFVGATYVPLNPTYTQRELLHACSLSQPKIVFTSYQTVDYFQRIADQQSFIKKLFVFGSECHEYDRSFNIFLCNDQVASKNYFICPHQNMKKTIAMIFCSSGTTGIPKAVQLSQYSTWFSVTLNVLNGISNECRLTVTPWTHVFGCFTVIRGVIHGTKMVSLPKFDANQYLASIAKFKVTTLMVVPPLIVFMSKSPLIKNFDTTSVQYALSTAAPLSADVLAAIGRQIPQLKIRQYYGMSEGGTFISQTDTHCKPGSVGVLRSGVYCKALNMETGKAVGPNVSGELVFKSPGLMKGYVGDTNSTQDSFDKDGWFHTGDIGFYDEDREWFIVDRLKELIKYKGFQVPPAELAAIILSHPLVKDVGVIGIPDELAGELPMAFVVKQGDCTEKHIIDFVASQASPAKRLHGGVRFVKEIPKNTSVKILRRVLREMLQKSKL